MDHSGSVSSFHYYHGHCGVPISADFPIMSTEWPVNHHQRSLLVSKMFCGKLIGHLVMSREKKANDWLIAEIQNVCDWL
jgi:hypothetical protein